jgi:hypothetical protein
MNGFADHDALGERTAVMRARGADREALLTAAHHHHRFATSLAEDRTPLGQIGQGNSILREIRPRDFGLSTHGLMVGRDVWIGECMWRRPMRTLAAVMILSLASTSSVAAAKELVSDRTFVDSSGEFACLEENVSRDPAIMREREERIPSDSLARLNVALGMFAGSGPGGVGGYFGATPEKTPIGLGYGGFVSGDVLSLRPLWVNMQVFGFASPRMSSSTLMTDFRVGYAFSHHGNKWAGMPVRHHPGKTAYGCIFSRADAALVIGAKWVSAHGDDRVHDFTALETGVQLRFLRDLHGNAFGLDMDFIGLYDPELHGGGAQIQDVLHVGKFAFTETIGGLWKRGVWVFLGIGSTFDI